MTDVVETGQIPEMNPTRRIPPPDGRREPMKASVFERMAKSAANLMPIFPYDEAGAIVPCGTIMFGGPDRDYGHFFHGNSVSEVCVTFGSNEAMLQSGSIMALQKFHGVNSFLRDQNDPEAFVVATITQRQGEEAGQNEALVAKCKKCKQEIVRLEYPAGPAGAPDFDPTRFGKADDVYHQFSTLAGSSEFVAIRNSEDGRTCSNCGHVHDLFPNDPWGWQRMVDQTRVVNASYHQLRAKAEEAHA
ncbi:hypothetical protein [Mycolicibacterium sp. lyk4-40-TYG-92]|uniref:hypothetical protein n=1 Tax=Mycolicibacterium sp. lyk4-40-TYG-92 TaxID=3040295 RepID=UPI00254DD1F6|nr:hypothetical protein [Mycolicibacterium sp. lyk4-40-TYG-92]